ncbi:MAG: T9SS type A sorting domain-containing protein [Bacteroidetes bacterium]|nr:T9SS type A sorting domain-containing protein [Bacteroidota bacterium]
MKRTSTFLSRKIFYLVLLFSGAAFVAKAQPGNALNYDGIDDYVTIGTGTGVYAAGSSYTKEAWVLYAGPNINDAENVISSADPFYIDGGQLKAANSFDNIAPADVIDPTQFPQGRWIHVAVTYDAATTTMKLYRDGVLIISNGAARASASGQNYIGAYNSALIGAGGIDFYWKGNIDEVKIYNVALSQAQIQSDMVSTGYAVPGNIIAAYNFDIGVAGGSNIGFTTLTDNSGNSLDGTLNNFSLTVGIVSNWVESYALIVPVATSATNVTGGNTGFTANWNTPVASGTIDNYLLYVSSTPDLNSPVAGSPFTVAFGTNSYAVTGLTAGNNYYYAVAADKASVTGTGALSNVISTLALLPVNLVNFTVNKTAGANQLQWTTATEINSKYFVLERSVNGSGFTAIATISSSGNSSTAKTYMYNDILGVNLPPVYYYRLKMVDNTGNFTYSDRVLVKNSKGIAITVYPNPAADVVRLNVTDKTLLNTTASIADMSGKVVAQVLITQTATQVNISQYQSGVYVIRLANGESIKLIKE